MTKKPTQPPSREITTVLGRVPQDPRTVTNSQKPPVRETVNDAKPAPPTGKR